jgi:hypothetical protein
LQKRPDQRDGLGQHGADVVTDRPPLYGPEADAAENLKGHEPHDGKCEQSGARRNRPPRRPDIGDSKSHQAGDGHAERACGEKGPMAGYGYRMVMTSRRRTCARDRGRINSPYSPC